MLTHLLERLAEMFPSSNYQSKLEAYIASKYPQNAADVDRLQQEYTYKQHGTWL
jgi:hypothetical protein